MSGNHVKIAARYGQPGEALSEITRLRAAIRQLAFHAPAGRRDPVAVESAFSRSGPPGRRRSGDDVGEPVPVGLDVRMTAAAEHD